MLLLMLSLGASIIAFAVTFAARAGSISLGRAAMIFGVTMSIAAGIYGASERVDSIALTCMLLLPLILVSGMAFIFFRSYKR